MSSTLIPNLWNATDAPTAPLDALRYRSHLLGNDLRITNFAGGNTSAKYDGLLAVKGSGSHLGSITNAGFALLHQHELDALKASYRGVEHEDEMVLRYPACAAENSTVRTSIDTPLHAYLPFPHIDHLHPEWVIALAASANGQHKLAEFNRRYQRHLIWIPWLRPGFELGLVLERAVALAARHGQPCDGLVLANHGLFTWGSTSQECYEQSLAIINEMGDFVLSHHHQEFGGPLHTTASQVPHIENSYPHQHFTATPQVLEFCNSHWASALCDKGTSCPDHFLRTKVEALYLAPGDTPHLALAKYRERYTAYYDTHREPDSPALRDPNRTVIVAAGTGLFTYGPTAHEARITSEFFESTINVMAGATALGGSVDNYVALPPREAFRIEYWSLEEAKLRDRKMATALPGA